MRPRWNNAPFFRMYVDQPFEYRKPTADCSMYWGPACREGPWLVKLNSEAIMWSNLFERRVHLIELELHFAGFVRTVFRAFLYSLRQPTSTQWQTITDSQLHGSRLTTVSHSVSPIHARSSPIQTLQHPLVTFVAVAWTEEADQLSISAAYTWVLTKTNIVTISYWWKHTSLLFYCDAQFTSSVKCLYDWWLANEKWLAVNVPCLLENEFTRIRAVTSVRDIL